MLRYVLFIVLITPSLASAFDGVFTMKGVTQRKYFPFTENQSVLYYTIEAKQRIEHKNQDIMVLSYKKSTARDVLEYKQGSLTFSDIQVHFQSAYYFQGVFYMENARGRIKENSFSSREISFNPYKHTLQAPHITFADRNSVKVKTSFTASTLPDNSL